jgi:hypothetical protein
MTPLLLPFAEDHALKRLSKPLTKSPRPFRIESEFDSPGNRKTTASRICALRLSPIGNRRRVPLGAKAPFLRRRNDRTKPKSEAMTAAILPC